MEDVVEDKFISLQSRSTKPGTISSSDESLGDPGEGGGGGVLPEKSGGGVRPASQIPYPIYDQNLRFSLPYL